MHGIAVIAGLIMIFFSAMYAARPGYAELMARVETGQLQEAQGKKATCQGFWVADENAPTIPGKGLCVEI